jgi:hypothetical protein
VRNYHENNRLLVEKALMNHVKDMCIRLQIGLADWDINEELRDAIQEHEDFWQVADLAEEFDTLFQTAMCSNVVIDPRFKSLYPMRAG